MRYLIVCSMKHIDFTYLNKEGFPVYRRRNDGRFVENSGVSVDDQVVVPYNPIYSPNIMHV